MNAVPVFEMRSELACSQQDLFEWHARPEAFLELQPPWEQVRQLSPPQRLLQGQLIRLSVRIGLLQLPWHSLISELDEPAGFTDIQRRGPFARWEHRHCFLPLPAGGTQMLDSISYALPAGALGSLVAGRYVESRLQRMFEHRHRLLRKHFGTRSPLV
ncbi:SRPBCC family protein [bacterium]|nr:SRPBCC family protein [bacterium]